MSLFIKWIMENIKGKNPYSPLYTKEDIFYTFTYFSKFISTVR